MSQYRQRWSLSSLCQLMIHSMNKIPGENDFYAMKMLSRGKNEAAFNTMIFIENIAYNDMLFYRAGPFQTLRITIFWLANKILWNNERFTILVASIFTIGTFVIVQLISAIATKIVGQLWVPKKKKKQKKTGRQRGREKIYRIDCSFSYFMASKVKDCLFFSRLFITVMHKWITFSVLFAVDAPFRHSIQCGK